MVDTESGGSSVESGAAGEPSCDVDVFGSVNAERRQELQDLVAEVVWDRMTVRADVLDYFGRRALGVDLDGDDSEFEHLEDRLGRTTRYLTEEESRRIHDHEFQARLFREDDPLVKMSRSIPIADLERKRRRQKQRGLLSLHVTSARLHRDCVVDLGWLEAPVLGFELSQVVLFESISGLSSSYHAIGHSKDV